MTSRSPWCQGAPSARSRLSLVLLLLAFCMAAGSCDRGLPKAGEPCGPDGICGEGLACVDGVCLSHPCADIECSAGEICIEGTCHPRNCKHRDCPEDFICLNGYCVSARCANVTCEPGHACADGRCYPTDCAGVDCGAGVCVDGGCVSRSCVGISCADGEACALGECHPVDCAIACAPGEVCVGGECVEASCVGVTCPPGEACGRGLCWPVLCEDESCGSGAVCVDGVCTPSSCAGVTCPDGMECAAGECRPVECSTRRCGPGEVCDEEMDRCVPAICYGRECPEGEMCVAGGYCVSVACGDILCPDDMVCDDPDGYSCVDPSCYGVECGEGELCVRGACYPEHCPAHACDRGEVCVEDRCIEAPCVGIICPDEMICAGGECVEPTTCPPGSGEHEDYPGECHEELDVPCDPSGAALPDNAGIDEDELVTIMWDDQAGWSPPEPCGWSCDPGFGEHEAYPGECRDTAQVPCEDSATPANATAQVVLATIVWDDEEGWSPPEPCEWSCDECYHLVANECVGFTIFPGRTWPESPLDLEVEILGAAFDMDTVLIWDVGGAEILLAPLLVETDRIVVLLPAGAFTGAAREVPVAVTRAGEATCPVESFVLGGVLPDTGQTTCYDDDLAIACPAPGQPFFGQDAQYGWDLLVTSNHRFDRHLPAANQPVVLDRMTQLEWQGCIAGLSGAACGTGTEIQLDWYGARHYCDSLEWGGHDDWELPDPRQLISITDAERHEPSIAEALFPATAHHLFVTSLGSSSEPANAWFVSFADGYMGHDGRYSEKYVRCVRSREEVQGSLVRSTAVSGEPVVRDTSTGLIWQGCSAGQRGDDCGVDAASTMPWVDALAYCEGLVWAGRDDWRLPNRLELQSIIDYDSHAPATDTTSFPGMPEGSIHYYTPWYWSSSTYVYEELRGWVVSFRYGYVYGYDKYGSWGDYHVRCVRGGIGPQW